MFNHKVKRLLISSTILSSCLSIIIIVMTIVHHLKIQESIDEIKHNGFI
ncbi:hypothetical protein AWH56_013220 [Anaerobacillus isosaccharinicus]|uniref:Uncharacterized protein n=1 Tax=Anaerobacillus isosaccharinicus TaxID=1532552 RepID=A0A7S7RDV4_9BACI|nr:hypothetical protein [Anaerobacillus isosaccharinicus]MBA5588143.1 hypothetical protein [Anaerobacillus isosaccharinicus]QOY38403.1 hypothetical protein AWH56_013220 [Anaerobacillus isosaccharinicus]